MQNYERLINHFFYHFNITIISKLKEHKNTITSTLYSVSYRVGNAANLENNGLVVRFSFNETDEVLSCVVTCSYDQDSLNALRFDGNVFKDELTLGLKCIDFLKNQKITYSYGLLDLSATMNKKSKEIVFERFTHTINIYIKRLQKEKVNLLVRVNKLLDMELNDLEIETKNIGLNDKLDLLAMVRI